MIQHIVRYIFSSMLVAGFSVPPMLALAETVTVPYSVTFTAVGTIVSGSYDNLGLFGGGDLVGLSFVDTLTVVYPGVPWNVLSGGYYTGVDDGAGTDTFAVNGHSYSFSGDSYAFNLVFPDVDERYELIDDSSGSSYYDVRYYSLVKRSPSQWSSDPAAANIFSNNTVSGSSGTSAFFGLFFIFVLGAGEQTSFVLDDSSVQSTYATTAIVIPEPSTWVMMLLGFASLGYTGYRKAKNELWALA